MAINTKKLKCLIIERGTTQQAVAKSIGMDRSTFYRKMKSEGTFTIKEAINIVKVVPLTKEEAVEIFFGNKVAKTLQTA